MLKDISRLKTGFFIRLSNIQRLNACFNAVLPWANTACMNRLRTPRQLPGPEAEAGGWSHRSGFERQHGARVKQRWSELALSSQ
jgi:hypothetical protein